MAWEPKYDAIAKGGQCSEREREGEENAALPRHLFLHFACLILIFIWHCSFFG